MAILKARFIDCDYGVAQDLGRPGSAMVPVANLLVWGGKDADSDTFAYTAYVSGIEVPFISTVDLGLAWGQDVRGCVVDVVTQPGKWMEDPVRRGLRVLAVRNDAKDLGLIDVKSEPVFLDVDESDGFDED